MNNGVEEDIIIRGCLNGDIKAQELLYKNYYGSMINLCMRYMKSEEDAVDALNNGFLKVFRNLQRYDPSQASLYTWIRTVVVRCCLDVIKKKNKVETFHPLMPDNGLSVQPEAIEKFKASEVLQLVRRLAPATQTVFNLYVVEGYNHREIADLLGVSEGTSKWHLSEARKNLRKMIKQQELNHS